jgi:hypothetical protein
MLKNIFFPLTICLVFALIPQLTLAKKSTQLPFIQVERVDKEILDASSVDVDYHTIESIEIIEEEKSFTPLMDSKLVGDLGAIVMAVDKLIAVGKKIWQIVEAGRPVLQTDFVSIHVLPKGEGPDDTFYRMENWQAPRVKSYTIKAKNKFKNDVVVLKFNFLYQHGGQLEGKGRYLTGVNILPHDVEVAWGYSLNSNSSLLSISNRGTAVDPIAGATLTMTYKIKTMLKETVSSVTFHVTGDGELMML